MAAIYRARTPSAFNALQVVEAAYEGIEIQRRYTLKSQHQLMCPQISRNVLGSAAESREQCDIEFVYCFGSVVSAAHGGEATAFVRRIRKPLYIASRHQAL